MVGQASNLLSGVNVHVTKIDSITSAPSLDASNNQIKNSLAAIDASLNLIKLNLDASVNFGRNVGPTWVTPDVSWNAVASSNLVVATVSAGKQGFIYGWEIASEDTSNNFTVDWTSGGAAKRILIIFAGSGTAMNQYQGAAANEGFPADAATNVTIKNSVAAQTAKRLQARLLYGEV